MLLRKNFKCSQFLKVSNALGRSICSSASSPSSSAPSTTSTQNEAAPKLSKVSTILANETYGQPTPWTHPHLINGDELVPCVQLQEFQRRRECLMRNVRKLSKDVTSEQHQFGTCNQLIVIPAATKKFMSDNIPYVFRQNSDFFYLTGCLEPDTVLMMSIDGKDNMKSMLFMRPKDKHSELWEGARTGTDAAVDMFGVDEAYTNEQFKQKFLERVQSEKTQVWCDMSKLNGLRIYADIHSSIGSILNVNSPTQIVQSMRLFKSPAEQELMRRTCQIASNAINEVMAESRPGLSEHHLFAMVDYKCRMKNANHLAYPPVVAGGKNATVIHYINNNQLIKSNDLILMDAGCEYGGYSSDIARTWPASGTFTQPQRILYDIVLQVQKELIDTLLKEGGDTLDRLFDTMCIKLGKYLQEAGLVSKQLTSRHEYGQAGYRFCPHHVSHYLGMDVHDTPHMSRNIRLMPGMVFTVEPGIYIGQDWSDVPPEFRGIGVRIEDDILITPDNRVEVLTADCVKESSSLENLFKSKMSSDSTT